MRRGDVLRCTKCGIAKCSCVALSCVMLGCMVIGCVGYAERNEAGQGKGRGGRCCCCCGGVGGSYGYRAEGKKICPRVSLLVLIVWGKRNLVLRLNYLLVLLLSSESIEIDISIS